MGRPGEELQGPARAGDRAAYRRLKLLGQGSFGRAFLARDLGNDELCVLKQIRVDKMDAKARETAVREALALKKVSHPNVVAFREVFVRDGWLCLVMEYADGGDLCAAVKERAKQRVPFEESAVLECFGQVADAVRCVHSARMVHRDIKSRNIFLCRTGRALLGDFGLVKVLESTMELAKTCVGTPYYLSPEIIQKQPYSYKTDIWSLGVLLYEMAALERPFLGTLETLPRTILKGTYKPLGDHYTRGLKELVDGMLCVDPVRRLDLAAAVEGPVLGPALIRAREALGLQPAAAPRKPSRFADRMRRDVADYAVADAKEPEVVAAAPAAPTGSERKSDWIGFDTMCRRGSARAKAMQAAAKDGGPVIEDSSDVEGLDGPEIKADMSDDSWGSVVDGDAAAVAGAV